MNRHDIYELFMKRGDALSSSYLYNHFKRGRSGTHRPPQSHPLADAAWRAGRDSKPPEDNA